MSAERWERLTQLFEDAVARPPNERASFLATACGEDAALRAEVERLVAAHDRAGLFMKRPAISGAGILPTEESESSIIGRRYGAYRVVREIGRGGMGAVYLAERADGHFEQRVALKLIKRGMDTDLVLQRFRAERQILASLDHPHIARLLDGGTTDEGRPYFVMEYIEGEPIDEYADAHRLSLAERLRLFLKVCSAVAHAHRKLVIHRDIKPVNILVTADGVPKLLDFGIAKVLDPGVQESTASVTGFRLLTPEYASPEQIEGRRATAASDVYSLGVVLYELLTGRSPYGVPSRNPLEVAEAVRTVDPERPSTAVSRPWDLDEHSIRRRRVERDRATATRSDNTEKLSRHLRGDLDTIVLMALRKEPLRRYQTVEQLAEDIERHLSGLPVHARRDGVGYRVGKFLRRNRAAVAAASLAALVALVLGAGLVAYRGSERGVDASLVGLAALAPRDRILVAGFADHTGDSSLGPALSDALQVDLTQSPRVQVLSARQIRSALARMERSPDLALDDSLAREVAVREGVKAFVTGSISRVAGRYTLTARLVSADRGDVLVALRETAADSTDVIPAVGRLSARLRRRMGESLRSVRGTPSLEQVTTASLPALRAYSEGVRTINAGDRERGVALLDSAVKLDTGFASAWRVLGVTYGDMVEYGRAIAGLQHALANQARLPFYERYHTIASYSYGVAGNYDRAIDAYHRILERYPDDVRALNNLGYVFQLSRRYPEAESVAARAVAVDSSLAVLQMGVFGAQLLRGDYAGARRTLDRVEAHFPGLQNTLLAEIYLASARQDWPAAEERARLRLAHSTADDSMDGLETLSEILMTRGRLAEAERQARRAIVLGARLGSPGRHLASSLHMGWLNLRYRHDTAAAIGVVDQALARFPLDSIDEGDRPYDDLARFFAAAGAPARARDLVSRSEHTLIGRIHGVNADRRWTFGVIELAEQRAASAEPDLHVASDSIECPICALPDLARAEEALGRPDSAIADYERYLATSWKWRFEPDAIELGWTLKRLGELYEQRGDSARAAERYAQLLRLWQNADRELAPTLVDVRRRVASREKVAKNHE